MPSLVNSMLLDEYKERYASVPHLISIGYPKLTVEATNELRGRLAEQSIRLDLVKNRIANLAFRENGHPEIEPILKGMSALAVGGEDPVAVARFLVDYRKEHKEVEIHGALVEGKILDTPEVIDLSKSPTREELKGIIAGQALSPGAKVAGALLGPARTIAGQIKKMIEDEEGEAA